MNATTFKLWFRPSGARTWVAIHTGTAAACGDLSHQLMTAGKWSGDWLTTTAAEDANARRKTCDRTGPFG